MRGFALDRFVHREVAGARAHDVRRIAACKALIAETAWMC
jgi:hypothetical protein